MGIITSNVLVIVTHRDGYYYYEIITGKGRPTEIFFYKKILPQSGLSDDS